MNADQIYRNRLKFANEIIESNTYVLQYLLDYAEQNRIPLPTDSNRYRILEAHADRIIHEFEAEIDSPTKSDTRNRHPDKETV